MVARRISFVAVAITVFILLIVPQAQAALFLVFETRSYQPKQYEIARTGGIGSPGDSVRARTGGRGAVGAGEVMPAFLTAGDYPSTIESADALAAIDGVTPIGQLRADDNGNGRLAFRTPNLPSGQYQIVVYCQSCAAFSAGSNVVAVAPFRVTQGSLATPRSRRGTNESGDGAVTPLWTGVVLALCVISGIWLTRRRPKRADASG